MMPQSHPRGLVLRAVMEWMIMLSTVLLLGCEAPPAPRETGPVAADTSGSGPSAEIEAEVAARYADTVFSDTVLTLYDERHVLTITGVGRGEWNFDRVFRIQLTDTRGLVIDTFLTKNSFADSLDMDFRERAGLYALDFDCVRSQSLYFNAFTGVDESDNIQLIDFFLTYAGPKKGRLVYWTKPEEIDALE
jgi:hypothetical protein